MFILLAFSACKTTKTIVKQDVKPSNMFAQFIEQIQKVQPQFKTANINKMTVELNVNGRTVNVSANCKIKKDSAMFVSFQLFGFEVFKAELMADSVKVLDKMNRRYYMVDYSYFSKRFGVNVDYYSLQSLFTAQLFCVGKRDIQADSCKLVAVDNIGKTLNYETGNIVQSTQLSLQNVIQSVQLKAKNSDYQLNTSYGNYTNTNGISFPQNISLSANSEKSKMTCNFSILSAEFNTNLKFIATSTDRYTRGDIDQLLKK
jgi:hypothetical protein